MLHDKCYKFSASLVCTIIAIISVIALNVCFLNQDGVNNIRIAFPLKPS